VKWRAREADRDRLILKAAEKRPDLLADQELILTRPANPFLALVCSFVKHPWSGWYSYHYPGVEMAWCRRCSAQKIRLRPASDP
jgi:hypothetical protein